MTTYEMRSWVKEAYSGKDWAKRVDAMSDAQVIALYYSLLKQGKIKR